MNQKIAFLGIFLLDKMFLELISSPAWTGRCSPRLERARTLSLHDILETTQHVSGTCRVQCWTCPCCHL